MTTYEKQLAEMVEERYAGLTGRALVEKLIEIGVVDYSRCKILAVREAVGRLMKKGMKKTDAMWTAAEQFACSYEYIRKCMYNYLDINLS